MIGRLLFLTGGVVVGLLRYSRACFQIRNEWMVDRSARVIAVFNGQSGGTKNTINYARSNGIEVIKS